MTWSAHVEALLGAVGPLGNREFAPHAARWDDAGLDAGLAARCSEWGLFGLSAPEASGGAGVGMLGTVAVVEDIAAHSGSLAIRVAIHEAAAVGLALGLGDDELLARALGGDGFVGWCGASRGLSARAESRVRLQGAARMVPADGDVVAVGQGPEGAVVGFLRAADVGARRVRAASGLCAAGWADLELDVEATHAGDDALARRLAARISVGVAATACGLARAAITRAVEYARVREQFGQAIANFQAIQWKLANSATERDAAWMLTVKAAARLDAVADDAADAAARAQLAAVRSAVAACSEALQVHGGYGYTREFPIERLLRDARACSAIDRGDDDLRAAVVPGIVARFA